MDRRVLILSSFAALAAGSTRAQDPGVLAKPEPILPPGAPPMMQPPPPPPPPFPTTNRPPPPAGGPMSTGNDPGYSADEIVNRASDFLGATAESVAAVVERTFKDNGRPTGYIAGEEGSAALVFGLRYGKGLLYMKNRQSQTVYWQGPSAGFDAGGNASRVFVLCYGLMAPDDIYRRFPGVEGTAYFVGGLGVNYQRADNITLAPIRAGVGFRLGANLGYLSYSRKRHILPF